MKESNHPDLVKKECADCNKVCYVIQVEPPDDPNATLIATGMYVEGYDDMVFVLCDACAGKLYDDGKLAYGGTGALLIRR